MYYTCIENVISKTNLKCNISSFKVEAKNIEIESVKSEKTKNKKEAQEKSTNKNGSKRKLPVKIFDESKVFAIYERRKMIDPLRMELIKRGWTEKIICFPLSKELTNQETTEEKTEASLLIPTFIWLSRSNAVAIEGSPIVNRLKQRPSKNFCFKDILVNYGREVKNGNLVLNLPRTFKLFENEKENFLEDYRRTAYSSFIRYLHATGSKAFSPTGKINLKWIEYAIEKLETAIASHNSKPSFTEKHQIDVSEFDQFKKIYQSVVKFDSKIKACRTRTNILLQNCKVVYDKCEAVWSYFEKDGFYNLWLLKPARRSLGIGIRLFDDDTDIFSYVQDNKEMKYLVQKYVERPMLIYNTKFDLRQYFLIVHHVTGVSLWMYKMCYLKFSTKLYDPLNYKVSVHITNTAIQSKYTIDKKRSSMIPRCNEWSSERFLQYLKSQQNPDLWDNKIYPAMKKNVITTVSAALDLSMIQPNHFQLYGCDFVIDDNYEPVLLEINGCPILTSVICPMCLKDVVKVIIDLKENPLADTGHFEKIWEKKL